jgi:hypothetical protein
MNKFMEGDYGTVPISGKSIIFKRLALKALLTSVFFCVPCYAGMKKFYTIVN